jgi:hypothetical protein
MPDLATIEQRTQQARDAAPADPWAERYAQDVSALLAKLATVRAELDDLVRDRWAASCGSCD